LAIKAQRQPRTIEQARVELSRRLEARRSEIEAAVMNRVYAVAEPSDLDPEYAEGLKAAVSAAVDYGLASLKLGEEHSPSPPLALLAQARLAARAGVSLDTVLRRYFAGHALLGDFLVEEAEGGRLLRGAALQKLLRGQAALFDRLLAAVAEEHGRESCERLGSSEQRKAERVERLLAGELVDVSGLGYELEASHLALVAKGVGVEGALRRLASVLDRQLLMVGSDDKVVWAWLGGRRGLGPDALERCLAAKWPQGASLAIGEPARGLAGWRTSHRQAKAALPIALRAPKRVARYADVALLASVLQNDLLAASLRQLYLAPLEAERDGGEVARETLRAYFAAGRNMSSAAAVLGVSRPTISNRLRAIEERLDRPLDAIAAELEVALRFDDLVGASAHQLSG
jgi:PucR C-terminal helix-turn-helix domain/GGDEF-like domain